MEDVKVIPVKTRDELRTWLQNNCHTERSCWVLVSMTPSPDRVLYLDAVEEALCFGWIDGIKNKITNTELAQRLSPRSKKSSCVNVNINMYTFACLRMYKITYPLEQNDPSIGKIRLQW